MPIICRRCNRRTTASISVRSHRNCRAIFVAEELTIQRLLAVDHAADSLVGDLEYSFLPALRKAVKAVGATRIPKQIRLALEAAAKDIQKALREYQRMSTKTISSEVRVTIFPEPDPRKEAA